MGAYIELSRKVIDASKQVWKIYKQVSPAEEALSRASRSFDMAFAAFETGKLGANDEQLEKIRVYVEATHDALVDLSKKDENYWILRSGANWFQPSSVQNGKNTLLSWKTQLQALSKTIDIILPIAKGAAAASATSAGMALDILHSGPTSLVALDSLALDEIATNLSASKWEISKIERVLSNTLKVY